MLYLNLTMVPTARPFMSSWYQCPNLILVNTYVLRSKIGRKAQEEWNMFPSLEIENPANLNRDFSQVCTRYSYGYHALFAATSSLITRAISPHRAVA